MLGGLVGTALGVAVVVPGCAAAAVAVSAPGQPPGEEEGGRYGDDDRDDGKRGGVGVVGGRDGVHGQRVLPGWWACAAVWLTRLVAAADTGRMSREAAEAGSNARQRVRWARRALDGWGAGAQDPVRELRSVVYATTALEAAAVLYVAAARDRGASWAVIGRALGVSRQAARQRYAGAVRRRESYAGDWRRDLARAGLAEVREQRGVWEGRAVVVPRQAQDRGQ